MRYMVDNDGHAAFLRVFGDMRAGRGAARGKFRGENFMTPNWIGYVEVDGEIVEITSGTGFDNEPIYGVTFSNVDPVTGETRADDRSQMFFSLEEAREYLEGL